MKKILCLMLSLIFAFSVASTASLTAGAAKTQIDCEYPLGDGSKPDSIGEGDEWDDDEPDPPKKIGDVNGDGIVDIFDSTLIQKFAVEKINLTATQKLLADVNYDKNTDVLDAIDIQKFAVDRLKEFKRKSLI